MRTASRVVLLASTLCGSPTYAGTLLVANKSSDTLTLVDADSAEVIKVLPTGAGPHEVDVSPDGRTAVVANYGFIRGGNSLTVIDVPTAAVTGTIQLGQHSRPHGLVWLQDNRRAVVTAQGSKHLLVIDLAARRITGAYPTDQEGSHMVAIAQGDQPVAFVANTSSGSVTRVELRTGKVLSIPTGAGAEGIAVAPDGATVWIAHYSDDSLKVLDADTLKTIADLKTGQFPIRVEFTHDGSYAIVTNARSGTFGVYDVTGPALVREIALPVERGTEPRFFDFIGGLFGASDASVPIGIQSAPGRLWIALANRDRVIEVDVDDWMVTRTIDVGEEPDGMAWSSLTVRREVD